MGCVFKKKQFSGLRQFLKKNWFLISLSTILVCGLLVRLPLLRLVSPDMEIFLLPWVEELSESGLSGYTGDYNVVYVSILNIIAHLNIEPILAIKAVSIMFDIVLAITATLITREILRKTKRSNIEKKIYELATFMMVFLWPTVILNSAVWGQCDSIYSAFCLIAILMLLKKKWNLMMTMIGVAISFKLQAVFILPFVGIYWLTTRFKGGFSLREAFSTRSDEKSFSIWKFLLIPCAFFAVAIPGIIMGWPIEKTITVYAFQVGEYAFGLSIGYPNIYYLFSGAVPDDLVLLVRMIGVIVSFIVVGVVCWWLYKRKIKWNDKLTLMIAAGLILIEAFFFPQMMGRYTYIAEAMILIYLIIYQRDKWILIELILVFFTYIYRSYEEWMYFIAAVALGMVNILWWLRIRGEIDSALLRKTLRGAQNG